MRYRKSIQIVTQNFLLTILSTSVGAASYEDSDAITHPFLYLTESRRPLILDNIKNEPMASIYAGLIDKANSEFYEIDQSDWDAKNHGKNGEIAVANAFLAWLNNDRIAADRAISAMELLQSNWDDHTSWGINIRMPDPLIHYTAAWDFLMATTFITDQQAADIEEKLTTITDLFFKKYVVGDTLRELALTVTQNNHPIRTAASIGFVALAFQTHPNAKEWLDWSVSELAYLLGPDGKYIQADGVVSEGPFYFNYGFAPTIAFLIALENRQSHQYIYSRNCINRADVDPWIGHDCVDGEEFTFHNPLRSELLHKVMDWSLSLRLPNGNRVPIADSPLRNQNGAAIFTYFGAEDYLYWDWESNPSDPYKVTGGFDLAITHLAYVTPLEAASPPTWTNQFFIDGGMAVLRSGWESDDRVLVLMGENGAARKTLHDHADGTSFVMAAYGDLLITDTGYYKPNSLQNAVTSAAGSHNLILIDGEGVPDKGLLNDWGDADAFLENVVDDRNIAYVESKQSYQNTDVVRGVAFVRGRYFILADHLNSAQDTEREFRLRLHAFAGKDLEGEVNLEAYGPHITRENGSVVVYTSSSLGYCELEEPTYRAYSSPHVHKLEKEAEHHIVTDSVIRGKAPDFLTVLAPYKSKNFEGSDAPLSVKLINTINGVAWEIRGENTVDVAWIREEDAPNSLVVASGDTITTNGTFVWVSLDLSSGLLVRGTELLVNDQIIVSNPNGTEVNIGGDIGSDTRVRRNLDQPTPQLTLQQNYPNPFNLGTTIRYILPEAGEVSLRVLDITGQIIRNLVDQGQGEGSYQVVWDGQDDSGAIAANGVYIYELRADQSRSVRKMLLMK